MKSKHLIIKALKLITLTLMFILAVRGPHIFAAPLESPPPHITGTGCGCETYTGKISVGTAGTLDGGTSGVTLFASMVTMPENGSINALEIYVSSTAGGNIIASLYTDNGATPGAPGTLIAQSAAQTSVIAWNVLSIPATAVSTGNYWIAVETNLGVLMPGDVGTDTANGGQINDAYWISEPMGTFPPTMPVMSAFNVRFTVAADYCPAICVIPIPTPTAIPVCQCPAVMGYPYVGASSASLYGIMVGTWYGMNEDGIASSMAVNIVSGTGRARLAIYADAAAPTNTATGPGALIAESDPFTVTSGWNTASIPQTLLLNGLVYWLAIESDDPSQGFSYDTGSPGDAYYSFASFGEFEHQFTNGVSLSIHPSIYVNYCPVSCPSTPTPSFTVSPVVTATSTPTITSTQSKTPQITVTYTMTYTTTGTKTQTSTITPTQSKTPQLTATYTMTVTPTYSFTPTSTMTITPTVTGTTGASSTATQSFDADTFSPTVTSTQAGAILTATPSVIKIRQVLPYPNPYNPANGDFSIAVDVNRGTSKMTFKFYTTGFRLMREYTSAQGRLAGTDILRINSGLFSGLAKGLYYYVINAEDAEKGTIVWSKVDRLILFE